MKTVIVKGSVGMTIECENKVGMNKQIHIKVYS